MIVGAYYSLPSFLVDGTFVLAQLTRVSDAGIYLAIFPRPQRQRHTAAELEQELTTVAATAIAEEPALLERVAMTFAEWQNCGACYLGVDFRVDDAQSCIRRWSRCGTDSAAVPRQPSLFP